MGGNFLTDSVGIYDGIFNIFVHTELLPTLRLFEGSKKIMITWREVGSICRMWKTLQKRRNLLSYLISVEAVVML